MKLDLKSIVTKQLSRPVLMLFTEPMVTAIALYASFVYALLFLTLEVFPIVYEEHRGWSRVVGSLPFLGLFVSVLSAVVVNLSNQPRYKRISETQVVGLCQKLGWHPWLSVELSLQLGYFGLDGQLAQTFHVSFQSPGLAIHIILIVRQGLFPSSQQSSSAPASTLSFSNV
jgi:hypothetical protein